MARIAIFMAVLAAFAFPFRAGAGVASEHWEAFSETATTITGDVAVSPSGISFGNGHRLAWQDLGPIPGFVVDPDGPVTVELYKITAPAAPVLERGNTICGRRQKVTYMATWMAPVMKGDDLAHNLRAIAAFFGAKPPKDEVNSNVCSSFYYLAPKDGATSGVAIDYTLETQLKREAGLSLHVYLGY